jgi:hypothetical protein
LHEKVFRIEGLLSGLRECAALDQLEGTIPEPAETSDALKEVSASLAALGEQR